MSYLCVIGFDFFLEFRDAFQIFQFRLLHLFLLKSAKNRSEKSQSQVSFDPRRHEIKHECRAGGSQYAAQVAKPNLNVSTQIPGLKLCQKNGSTLASGPSGVSAWSPLLAHRCTMINQGKVRYWFCLTPLLQPMFEICPYRKINFGNPFAKFTI